MREHLEIVHKTTGRMPPELDVPDIPKEFEYLMSVFYELSAARPVGMAVGPIAFEAIEAYNRLTGAGLVGWEVQTIKRLDIAWMKVRNG